MSEPSAFRKWERGFVPEKRDHDLEFRDAVKAAWNACAREAVKRIRGESDRAKAEHTTIVTAERSACIVESLLEKDE